MKKLIFIIPLIFFAFVGIAKADVSCERNPAGDTIYNQDIFNYSCVNIFVPSTCGGYGDEDCLYMQMLAVADVGDWFCSVPVVDTGSAFQYDGTLNNTTGTDFTIILKMSATNSVDGDNCLNSYSITIDETALSGFDVLSGSTPTGSDIITLPETALAQIYGHTKEIILNVWVILALAIGVPLGFWIIGKVIELIPKK